MNVGKIMQFATEGLKAVKSMPLAGKVAVGTLIGVGGLTGVLIGDSFEKGVGVKEEVKEKTELVTQPKEQADTTKDGLPAKIRGKDGFVFNMPETGKNNITSVSVEKTYPNGQPKDILFIGGDDKVDKFIEIFLKGDGTLDMYIDEKFSPYSGDCIIKNYKSNGELGSMWCFKDQKDVYESYDEDGRVHYSTTIEETKDRKYIQIEEYGKLVSKDVYANDGSERLLKIFEYNDDGTLKHTILPQYNEDGELVRRDTIPNK